MWVVIDKKHSSFHLFMVIVACISNVFGIIILFLEDIRWVTFCVLLRIVHVQKLIIIFGTDGEFRFKWILLSLQFLVFISQLIISMAEANSLKYFMVFSNDLEVFDAKWYNYLICFVVIPFIPASKAD